MPIICSMCKNQDEKIVKEEEPILILKIVGLIKIYNCFKNMAEENISKEFRLKNIDEIRKWWVKSKVCTALNYIE